eukprot:CAMPEP_0197234102 /NCGR_PEP_ID=MMETSP1429-20130617/1942_1 /TAXON_ID=49237 /ORGANISM="Chaetoceros  sp., Strain UNC1202" /LENGTH=37 /DNA_ID= /DNA_START= /DNA_END= /DNA_ORIENTATION=
MKRSIGIGLFAYTFQLPFNSPSWKKDSTILPSTTPLT